MAFNHGSKSEFWLQDAGGVLRNISTYLTSAGLAREVDSAETSALGTTDKTYVVGLKGATISLEGMYDPTVDSYLDGILGFSTARNFEYYPNGSPASASKPKYSGTCLLTSYEASGDVGDMAGISGELLVTGAVTRALS